MRSIDAGIREASKGRVTAAGLMIFSLTVALILALADKEWVAGAVIGVPVSLVIRSFLQDRSTRLRSENVAPAPSDEP